MSDDELRAPRKVGVLWSLLPGGANWPFALLCGAYLILDILAPWTVYLSTQRGASPYWFSTTFEDSLGGRFGIESETDGSAWKVALSAALFMSCPLQRGVFGIWIAFGPGRWFIRLATAMIASAFLYIVVLVPLSVEVESWRDLLAPFAAMPLELLSFVAPLAVVAVVTGRRVLHSKLHSGDQPDSRRFSISDILTITAVVAVAIALARWKEMNHGRIGGALPASLIASAVVVTCTAAYVLPVLWAMLAVRRVTLGLSLTGCVTMVFAIPMLLTGDANSDVWPMAIGGMLGLCLTVPCSLLLWRLSGYQLTRMPQRNELRQTPP